MFSKTTTQTAVVLLSALTITCSLLIMSPAIDRWERANNYPFGKLCDVFSNCRR